MKSPVDRGARHVAEILVVSFSVRALGGRSAPGGDNLSFDEETMVLLEELLAPYGQNPHWYFQGFLSDEQPTPWAFVCLPREIRIAWHIREARQPSEKIWFSPYAPFPRPKPADFEAAVGVLIFHDRDTLAEAAARSPVFSAAWNALSDRDPRKRWIVLLAPPNEPWVAEQEARRE